MSHKANGQQNRVAKPELLAVCVSCPCSSVEKSVSSVTLRKIEAEPKREEQPPTKRTVTGSNPVRGIRLISPTYSANCAGPSLRRTKGRVGKTHCYFGPFA
jgi:hypothetical protein